MMNPVSLLSCSWMPVCILLCPALPCMVTTPGTRQALHQVQHHQALLASLLDAPCFQDRLTAAIQSKQELRAQVEKQLGQEMGKFRDLEKEAAEVLLRARHSSGKLMVGSSCSSMC